MAIEDHDSDLGFENNSGNSNLMSAMVKTLFSNKLRTLAMALRLPSTAELTNSKSKTSPQADDSQNHELF